MAQRREPARASGSRAASDRWHVCDSSQRPGATGDPTCRRAQSFTAFPGGQAVAEEDEQACTVKRVVAIAEEHAVV